MSAVGIFEAHQPSMMRKTLTREALNLLRHGTS